MKHANKFSHFSSVICLSLIFVSLSACSGDSKKTLLAGVKKPAATELGQIKAIVDIASPKVGTLLQLRGIVGKGRLTVKQSGTDSCVSMPLRFVAGDFGGSTIGINSSGPIRLVIYSNSVVNKLLSGDEVVSENYDITVVSDKQTGDIQIDSGMGKGYGFVLNPGESPWAALFGLSKEVSGCGGVFEQLSDTSHPMGIS